MNHSHMRKFSDRVRRCRYSPATQDLLYTRCRTPAAAASMAGCALMLTSAILSPSQCCSTRLDTTQGPSGWSRILLYLH